MADKDYSQLSSATTASDSDLLALYPAGGPLKKLSWATFKSLIITALGSSYLIVTNNLSDLASASAARANLGLGSIATQAASAFFSVANNLSEVANAATARTNIGAAAAVSPTITGGMDISGPVIGNIQAVAGTQFNIGLAEFFTKSISDNTTFTITGGVAGKSAAFALRLTISSGATPTFTGVAWDNGVPPAPGNGTHYFGFIYDGSGWAGIQGPKALA